jgi:hypothetical protein
MFGLYKSTKLHRREALPLILEGYILLIKITIKYVTQAYGEEVSHDFSHHQVHPQAERPQGSVEVVFEQLRKCDREIKAVEYFCVGRDFGGEFEYGAMYAFQDIGGYREYML